MTRTVTTYRKGGKDYGLVVLKTAPKPISQAVRAVFGVKPQPAVTAHEVVELPNTSKRRR